MEKMSNSRGERSASDPSAWLLRQAGNLECCLWQGWIPLAPCSTCQHGAPGLLLATSAGDTVAHSAWHTVPWLCCWVHPCPAHTAPRSAAALVWL